MVAKLDIPPYDSVSVVNEVIDERTQFTDFYTALKYDWNASILNYIEIEANPNLIQPIEIQNYLSQERIDVENQKVVKPSESNDPKVRLTLKRKKSLIGLYTPKQDKKPYQILEDLRRKHGLLFCPSCGEPGKPGTLDHYLPKSEFPELSVVIANLTPMCSECQGRKGADYKSATGEKLFLHPYFDAIEEPIISLRITPPFISPERFQITVKDDIEEPLHSLAIRHIAGIDFIERFEEFCRLEYLNLLPLFRDERLEEDPDTAARMIRRFLRKAEQQSANRWEAIFYRGILEDVALLDYLDNGELPEYL